MLTCAEGAVDLDFSFHPPCGVAVNEVLEAWSTGHGWPV